MQTSTDSPTLRKSIRAALPLVLVLLAAAPLRTMAQDENARRSPGGLDRRFPERSAAGRLGRGFLTIVGLPFTIVRSITSGVFGAAQSALKKGTSSEN
ncbi:MAG: hypothetical protein ABMA01_03210 [Chthoniobacteraceae bacterium]